MASSSACWPAATFCSKASPDGKTTLLRTLARVLHLKYSRIQFTPDLMPADIVGSVIMETSDGGGKVLKFQPGPIFSNLVLADEINRATRSSVRAARSEGCHLRHPTRSIAPSGHGHAVSY